MRRIEKTHLSKNHRGNWRCLGEVCKVVIDRLVLADGSNKGPDDSSDGGRHRRPDHLGAGGRPEFVGPVSQGEPTGPAQVATASSAKG